MGLVYIFNFLVRMYNSCFFMAIVGKYTYMHPMGDGMG